MPICFQWQLDLVLLFNSGHEPILVCLPNGKHAYAVGLTAVYWVTSGGRATAEGPSLVHGVVAL